MNDMNALMIKTRQCYVSFFTTLFLQVDQRILDSLFV